MEWFAACVGLLLLAACGGGNATVSDATGGANAATLPPTLSLETATLPLGDVPNGRIVESYAAGAVRRADVVRFYDETLPQLGWSGRARTYRRDREVLRLGFEGQDGALVVRFSLSPR